MLSCGLWFPIYKSVELRNQAALATSAASHNEVEKKSIERRSKAASADITVMREMKREESFMSRGDAQKQ
jgi:hypothetical protein